MKKMDKIVSLCKRRGFIFPSSEIYGGLANSWDFGPLGVEIKNNIKEGWWKFFVQRRDDVVGLDSSIIMNASIWKSSGHIDNFVDPLVECNSCHRRFRVDHLVGDEVWNRDGEKLMKEKLTGKCPECGKEELGQPRYFNLMLKTSLGPVDDEGSETYLRPETAQGIFVNFKNVISSSRKNLPFGIAQVGKAFRNEITPGNFIFRTREFEQMEIEYFIKPPKNDEEWQRLFEEWRLAIREWISRLGLSDDRINELDVPQEELAHYSKKTIDFEYEFPFGMKEIYGLAYRGDFDLRNHEENSGKKMKHKDLTTGEEYWPHVIEPSFGVERTLLAVLAESYREEETPEGETRIFMSFPAWLAPIKVAVLPLIKNSSELVSEAKELYRRLREEFASDYDESGTIGKRYRRQDEIGTPFAVTVDFDTLEDRKVTVRERDSMAQSRVSLDNLLEYIKERLDD